MLLPQRRTGMCHSCLIQGVPEDLANVSELPSSCLLIKSG